MTSKIATVSQYGQKIWVDNISREFLNSGALAKMVKEDQIAGVTSNPAIFFKAISSDLRYQEQLTQLKTQNLTPLERYEQMAISDIREACQIMSALYQSSDKEDGYVSLEVSPHLAHNKEGTVKSALELWNAVGKPNLMIKVPATKEGIAAFEELVTLGINVNITLLFSLSQVNAVWDAYITGLEKRSSKGLPVSGIKTVASFFLSRVDSAIDDKLPTNLQGKTAINLAKQAYLDYLAIFHGERFKKLKSQGAFSQYLLWASTGTKNKAYSDVLYVEELIGPETINTVPDATLDAFRDHGVAAERLTNDIEKADKVLKEVEATGINLEELGNKLQIDGLKLFDDAFDQLLELVK
ncbi:transaldolase [Aquella oligotrophica]|uniref:Transaldolase n=1 Tax=Aquella oligotrophica TaxID=2067065 RepID=A0A2I7N932_9NEIS|nr:transaldolase [Aquella oligotrophica]AUR52966.1 transaldolase [Aquella oligotrophica]